MNLSKNPAYNLKAVLKETGIKPDVLRAWERRYGIPMPQRTMGGHRLYSEYDIEMIKWLIARQTDGLSISRAVEMWKEHIAQGHDPLFENQPRVQTALSVAIQPPAIYLPPETGLDAMRSHWLAACMNFNEIAAEQALNQAFAIYPVERVCLDVLQRGMAEVGGLWYENRASVQQEHFASALAMRRLDALLAGSPAPTRPETIIVGCPPDEWHAFTPMVLALFLRRRGFNVIYLGANVPSMHFVETVESVNASLVILAAQQLSTASSLQQACERLTEKGVTAAYGGRIFGMHPGMLPRIRGHYLGNRIDTAIERIETLLAARPELPAPVVPTEEYVSTLAAFIAQRPFIETRLNEEFLARGGDAAYLTVAHKFMGDNILAVLQLGDISFLESELDWLNVLLDGQNVPRNAVQEYLRFYSMAVAHVAGAKAGLIVEWLERRIQNQGS